jgi:hypothetical protein
MWGLAGFALVIDRMRVCILVILVEFCLNVNGG